MNRTKEEHIEVEGVVAVVLPGTMFRVELENKHMVLATICGKMRKRWVRITAGDRVKIEMSPYDLNKARHADASADFRSVARMPVFHFSSFFRGLAPR